MFYLIMEFVFRNKVHNYFPVILTDSNDRGSNEDNPSFKYEVRIPNIT